MYVCMGMYMCVCPSVGNAACVCICVWKPEVILPGLPLFSYVFFFGDSISHWPWGRPYRVGWLASRL